MCAFVWPGTTAAAASRIVWRSIIRAVWRSLPTLDIVPTYNMWHGIDAQFAFRIWHWMFLALPAPFPEEVIGRDPVAYWNGDPPGTMAKSLLVRSARTRALPRVLQRPAPHPRHL